MNLCMFGENLLTDLKPGVSPHLEQAWLLTPRDGLGNPTWAVTSPYYVPGANYTWAQQSAANVSVSGKQ